MIDFVKEFKEKTIPYENNFVKHGETLILCKFIEPDTLHIHEYIAFDASNCNRTARFLKELADRHNIIITGVVKPFLVGPTLSKKNYFFQGLGLDRLLKWYKAYGFTIHEEDDIIKIIRLPNRSNL